MKCPKAIPVLFLAVLGGSAVAQTPPPSKPALTVTWMYSDDGENATRMPTFAWTATGDVLLLDATRPAAERTLERFDVARGRRAPAVDAKAALASLAALAGADAVPKALEWPDDIDRAGTLAVYTFAGDLYLLDLASSHFSRLTHTPEEESVPRFSPDGRRVAFVRRNDLYVIDLSTRAETRLTRDGSDTVLDGVLSWVYWEEIFNHGEAGYWWSPDSSSIAFLRTDESPVSLVTFVDIAPAVPRLITQRYPKAGGANPLVTLGIVEVESGATVFVDPHDAPWEYVVGVTWLPDGRRVAVQATNRAQTRLDLYFADRATGKATHVLSDPDSAWVDQQELQFLPDGRFVWSSQRDGYTHLYLYGADGAPIRQLTSGGWSVRGPAGFYAEPLDSTWVDAKRGVVYFTAMAKSVIERQLYRVNLDGTGFAQVSREDGVHLISFGPDRQSYLDTFSAHCTPPSLGLHRADGAPVATLGRSRPDLLTALDWQCPELLTLPAPDGHAVQARLLRPKPFDPAKRYPVILYIYGGPAAPVVRDALTRNDLYDQILAHRGYAVLNVDPRSATGASKTDENAVAGKVFSDVELAEMLAGVKWIKAQPWVDPDRVGVWGWSGGGTSTLLLLTRSQEFKAGIAVAPVTDWHDYDSKFTEAYMRTPADNPEGYAHFDLVPRAKDLHGRLLLVFGSGDDNVHPQNSYAFENALIEAGKTFDLMVYPMRKHTIDDRPARIDLFNRMLEFWQRNL